MARKPSQFATLTDMARFYTGGITSRLGMQLHKAGVHPDVITIVGLGVVAIASFVAAQGHFFWAAVILILGAPLDALDGAVARAMQRKDKFGALLDSTLDRYADGFLFMGLAYYLCEKGNSFGVVLSIAGLLGSLLVSYVRARAEGLDMECKIGLFTRMERTITIFAMLLTGWIIPGLWVLAIGTNFTAIQRMWHVNRLMKQQQQGENS
jgi:CDP-diacylglycerol--glycerol-3-phosphate 3-phosphatidyltransferase